MMSGETLLHSWKNKTLNSKGNYLYSTDEKPINSS